MEKRIWIFRILFIIGFFLIVASILNYFRLQKIGSVVATKTHNVLFEGVYITQAQSDIDKIIFFGTFA
ncbi:MAG: hypothetical protein VX875_00365 [Pseudomonadota bacterium]|jgi:hypothetical protein|nr:hypothetical protein [Pseudomonadota bacterium]